MDWTVKIGQRQGHILRDKGKAVGPCTPNAVPCWCRCAPPLTTDLAQDSKVPDFVLGHVEHQGSPIPGLRMQCARRHVPDRQLIYIQSKNLTS